MMAKNAVYVCSSPGFETDPLENADCVNSLVVVSLMGQ